ncbi:hypothetical protein [Streptomyces thermolineatus]|uniref:hypothetical protein n=1 Tax=Streptomyces thermolineatus TaxID=44033 RepID=UPI00384D2630
MNRTEGVEAGRGWYAVKMPLSTTRQVLRALLAASRETGAVLYDEQRQVGYMFIRPRSLEGKLPGAVLITNGVVVVPRYPCSDVMDRRYWAEYGAQPPGEGRYADHDALVDALERIAHANKLAENILVAGAAP